jgi:hypothetical protein
MENKPNNYRDQFLCTLALVVVISYWIVSIEFLFAVFVLMWCIQDFVKSIVKQKKA